MSFEEAFGLVVSEYLAAGLPAVSSHDGGGVEIISPGTGVAFRQGGSACKATCSCCWQSAWPQPPSATAELSSRSSALFSLASTTTSLHVGDVPRDAGDPHRIPSDIGRRHQQCSDPSARQVTHGLGIDTKAVGKAGFFPWTLCRSGLRTRAAFPTRRLVTAARAPLPWWVGQQAGDLLTVSDARHGLPGMFWPPALQLVRIIGAAHA